MINAKIISTPIIIQLLFILLDFYVYKIYFTYKTKCLKYNVQDKTGSLKINSPEVVSGLTGLKRT